MKNLIIVASLFFSMEVHAVSECTGRIKDGTWVSIRINTIGASGKPDNGEVILEQENNKYGYRIKNKDIVQFFEYDELSDNSALVGLSAYVDEEFPIAIKYQGPNYVDMDHKSVLKEGIAAPVKTNFLRIWKGPGYNSKDQYQLTNIVCSTWPNI